MKGGGLWKRSISFYINLRFFSLDPDYVRGLSLGAIWKCCEGPGLSWFGIRVWGTKDLFQGQGVSGPSGLYSARIALHSPAVTSREYGWCLYRSADKFLARPGRKQDTATEDFDVHISYL